MGASWAEKTKEAYSTGLLTYHVFCDSHNVSEHQQAPIRANTLLAFLSSCAGSYSGSALANFTARLQAWHLLHGLPWQINSEELRAIPEGASCLAPASSKRPLHKPFWVDMLKLIHSLLDPESPKDVAIFACLTIVFYCIGCLGESTVQSIKQFNPTKHITHTHVSTDGIAILERIVHDVDASPNAHLFAWRHPTSGLRPLSRSEVIKCIMLLTAMLNLPNLKGHNLRIGGTLHYLLHGTPFDVVKTIGRWVGESFTIYLQQHVMILALYLNDMPVLLEHFTRYTMLPVH
ncbi:hypothetical protein EDC04DRAFT_2871985 [Pisolithus marmoratus]|nr:hypothetical protein EDC04DRAFT_2871985 [Pisolithus marmoratus]